jgi:biopolymer transport protein ExbB
MSMMTILLFSPLSGLAMMQAATASGSGSTTSGAGSKPSVGVGELFMQSFDIFTILLVLGSIAAVAVIVKCVIDIRATNITPEESERQIRKMIADRNLAGLDAFAQRDVSFYGLVMRAATNTKGDRTAVRNASELAASEQCGRWFRAIEPLNVIGNLGPLLGLAGTVWGMVDAFVSLGQAGGQADPSRLSVGISKALFHTLLGLMVAIPALLAFGLYRTRVDRLCTRAMIVAGELVESYCDVREGK